MSGSFNRSSSLFIGINGDGFIDNGFVNGRVDRWIFNTSSLTPAMYVNGSCYGLFVDSNDLLYCSLRDLHQVTRLISSTDPSTSTIVAGNGTAGLTSRMLNLPQGIYVDNASSLYVADCGNNRIQLFYSSQLDGITLVGNGSSQSMNLNCPTSVVLDQNGYIFVVDSNNHRIIGSGVGGFRCIVGCTGTTGSSLSQLSFPQSMAFDSYGNIFVADRNNGRLQKFAILTTPCSE